MKNTFLFILAIVIIIIVILISKINDINEINNNIQSFNLEYEKYLDKEITGIQIATIINKTLDNNEKEKLKKDDEKYININIKIIDLDKDTIIEMEKFYNGGIANFVQMYGEIIFKCKEIKYTQDGRVNYLLFEQISK